MARLIQCISLRNCCAAIRGGGIRRKGTVGRDRIIIAAPGCIPATVRFKGIEIQISIRPGHIDGQGVPRYCLRWHKIMNRIPPAGVGDFQLPILIGTIVVAPVVNSPGHHNRQTASRFVAVVAIITYTGFTSVVNYDSITIL